MSEIEWGTVTEGKLSDLPNVRKADIDSARNEIMTEIAHNRSLIWLFMGGLNMRLSPDEPWFTAACVLFGVVWFVLPYIRSKK